MTQLSNPVILRPPKAGEESGEGLFTPFRPRPFGPIHRDSEPALERSEGVTRCGRGHEREKKEPPDFRGPLYNQPCSVTLIRVSLNPSRVVLGYGALRVRGVAVAGGCDLHVVDQSRDSVAIRRSVMGI